MAGKLYKFDPEIFPLKIWVCMKPDLKKMAATFDIIDDDYRGWHEWGNDEIEPYWGACRITVREKKTGDTGCLLMYIVMSEFTPGQVAHEVSHAYDDFVAMLKVEAVGETRAYVTEWMVDKVWDIKTGKIK